MLTLLVAGVTGLALGVVCGFAVAARNAHRLVARLSPAERLRFARKVTTVGQR